MEGLGPGRIVLFKSAEGVEMPAIVTHVWNPEGVVNLAAFPPHDPDAYARRFTSVPYNEQGFPYSWRWLPRY